MTLVAWQERLHRHFGRLRSARTEEQGEKRIFALEHGLTSSEIEALLGDVREHIASERPLVNHSLPWIVYAAEIGYQYAGEEYWQTFEQATPGWIENGDRQWLRRRFVRFKDDFDAAEPQGPWADHFSIICWPITHAILPRDLQRQLARKLYELRWDFSQDLLRSPQALGRVIAENSWDASSRFRAFVSDSALVGQISASLLLHDTAADFGLIEASALERITRDLHHEQRAREWLKEARAFARDRLEVRGLSTRGPSSAFTSGQLSERPAASAPLGIEPRLILRPSDQENWEVYLEIPDLSGLLVRFPDLKSVLLGSRCEVNGSAERPLARGALLQGRRVVRLARWPQPSEPLLRFDPSNPQMELLLRTEAQLRPGPSWLFRVASDGLAYELRSAAVRADQSYILVTTKALSADGSVGQACRLQCEGCCALSLDVPKVLTEEWKKGLAQLNLGVAKTLQVWPAGLSALEWDGEGRAAWPVSERPCLAIAADHDLDLLEVSIPGSACAPIDFGQVEAGKPVFVELLPLPPGTHQVQVLAREAGASFVKPTGKLDVSIRVHERPALLEATYRPKTLMLEVDPPDATLNDLWKKEVDLSVRGPPGRLIHPAVALYSVDKMLLRKELPALKLPLTAAAWKEHFTKHFQKTTHASDLLDAADRCELTFIGGDLGTLSVSFERPFTPLRWKATRSAGGVQLTLHDDRGEETPAEVESYAFDTPTARLLLPASPTYLVPPGGGLYVARASHLVVAIVVPPIDFNAASVPSQVAARDRSVSTARWILRVTQSWTRAETVGDLMAGFWQRKVLRLLTRHLFDVLGGERWERAETGLASGAPNALAQLASNVTGRQAEAALAVKIDRAVPALKEKPSTARAAWLGECLRLSVGLADSPAEAQWIAEFALRLASDPGNALRWAGERWEPALKLLFDTPTIARAARYLVLCVRGDLKASEGDSQLFSGWAW